MACLFSKSELKLDLHTTCGLGDHPLQNPKLLPCQHSVCTECIKTKVSQGKKEMICPKCQLSIPLTEKEVDQLPDDFLYPILQKTKDNNFDCDMCKFENKNIPGTFQCLDCGDILCDECRNGHTKSRQTRLHRLVSVKEIQSGKYKTELKVTKQHLCETHSKPNQPHALVCYCEECQCLACQICVITQHQPQGHTCQTIDDVYEVKTKGLSDHITKLLDLKELDEKFAFDHDKGQGQNKALQGKLENEVYERAAVIMDIVEKVKQDKLTEIKGHFEKEQASIHIELQEARSRIIRTDCIVSYTQTFLEHSDKAEFLQYEPKIMKIITENYGQKDERSLISNILEFDELQIDKIEAIVSECFGRIKVETKTRGKYRLKDAPREWVEEPIVLFSADSGIGNAWDLTVTENEDIVAVCDRTIQVYNSEGEPKERINCNQLEAAWNVVAKGDTLYVSDRAASVLVMDFKGHVKKTIILQETGVLEGDKGLAVDVEGNIYISFDRMDRIYKCQANETSAKVFIQRGAHPDLNSPHYLCTTPGGELVVSNYTSSTIQVYDRNGEILWQYKGQGDMSLSVPWGVCCDREGYVYISDSGNHTIHVVRNGEFQRYITINNFMSPFGLALDKDDNLLCGYNQGHNITKFRIKE